MTSVTADFGAVIRKIQSPGLRKEKAKLVLVHAFRQHNELKVLEQMCPPSNRQDTDLSSSSMWTLPYSLTYIILIT